MTNEDLSVEPREVEYAMEFAGLEPFNHNHLSSRDFLFLTIRRHVSGQSH
jgi:hypothetical protein